MKHSVLRWLADQALLEPGTTAPFRLTPGQYASMMVELGPNPGYAEVRVCDRVVEAVDYHGRGIGDNIVLSPRLDLFSDTEFGMVSRANAVTSVPDNVACVEVIDAGNADHLRRGDLVFIDMFRTKQAHVLQSDMLYIAGGADFIARYDYETGTIKAIDNYVLTKPAPARMTLAMYGTSKHEAPRTLISEGFVSGLRHDGQPNARCVYQEVYDVGKLTARGAPGKMTKAERAALDVLVSMSGDPDANESFWDVVLSLRDERARGRAPDVAPGDLVSFCTDLGTRLRIRGEYHYAVPHKHILMAIDDAAIERESRHKDSSLILAL